jgi:hypothetical protein
MMFALKTNAAAIGFHGRPGMTSEEKTLLYLLSV